MEYKKIYYAIINKALRKQITGQRWKGDSNYYENHHIIPRSLGGQDISSNLVLLTAKEHYLCHWLLCKSFQVGTIERKKMIKAWFFMAGIGDTGRPTISMRSYVKYKREFGSYMSEMQTGKNNTQYGSHWYTNYITGEYKLLKGNISKEWVRGKHFHGEYSYLNICDLKNTTKYVSKTRLYTFYNPNTLEKIKCKLTDIPDGFITYNFSEYSKLIAQRRWDEYHSSNYRTLHEFTKYSTYNAISMIFTQWIPLYVKFGKSKWGGFPSNPELVGVYE